MTEPTGYIPPSKEELLLKDFLSWCGKEHAAVLVDINPNIAQMSNYTFMSHPKLIEEYLVSKQEGWAYD